MCQISRAAANSRALRIAFSRYALSEKVGRRARCGRLFGIIYKNRH
ncbi:hypothetical protein CGSMWGv00703Bmash_00295 [Gardnerella pickettii 00703Bmash]|nr:hypothetical protein CGSMWGv00703Bmash_00295 [Gardnerella pickettii 00703Bmash]